MLASFFFSRNPTLIIFGINRKMIQIPKNMVQTICRYPHREAAGMEEVRRWRPMKKAKKNFESSQNKFQ